MTRRDCNHAPLVLLLMLACRAADGEGGGVNHIADAPELSVVEVRRVGSVDDPDAGFSRIGGIAVDAQGAVYVLESQEKQIRVYDPNGQHIRTFGGEGSGPGEFKNPKLIGFRDDTLAIGDATLGRITFFDRSGNVLETLSMPPAWLEVTPDFMVMYEPVRFRDEGFATAVTRAVSSAETPRDSFFVPQVAVDRSGNITDTLRFDPWQLSDRISVGSADVRVPPAPPSTPLYLDGEHDSYVVERAVATADDQAAITVTRVAHSGDTIYNQKIRYLPIAFPVALIDTIVARAVRPSLHNQQADSGAVDNAVRRALRLPVYQPPVTSGRVGADGVLWLRLHDDATDQHQWLILEANGSLKGTVMLPSNVTIHWSSGEHAWAAVRDDFDVPWLVRYHLRHVTR